MARAWRPNSLIWQIAEPFPGADELGRRVGVAPLVAQILANRGITDVEAARAFLNPRLSDLHDPAELPGVQAAAKRIAQAVTDNKRIVIYGDYDVDGITGVAILHGALHLLGADPHFYVPHRLEEGYGVNIDAIRKLIREGTELLITVDCGISAAAALQEAVEQGVEVIVTDHHSPPASDALPKVGGIVHPQLGDYPNGDLSGAGVAFKLAWGIARTICGNDRVDEPMRDFLLGATSLAALGTIADVVPLLGENRVLAAFGLRALAATKHLGLRALLESANLVSEKLDAYHVGFILAPRINACGRMGHATAAVELLSEPDKLGPQRCKKIADHLAGENTRRRKIEQAITAQVIEMVESQQLDAPGNRAIVLSSDEWHGGVIGIVASRLVDLYARPVILIAINGEGCGQGSGRSVAGFHMRDALSACAEHLLSFGGHAMAGGLRIERDSIPAVTEAFARHASEHLATEQLAPTLKIDAEITLESLSFSAAKSVERLGPFGEGNPRPVVAIRQCSVLSPPKRMGRNGNTVGMILAQDDARIRAVGFG
ncbi:MAG: single-stranded-DNA-specific exonuclease RecJ, partial [Planctomycetota bacterium]